MNMEIPTCVIDANTLIDHIHQIKALVYDGHMRLAVPMSTIDRVDQQYRKSLEPKPEPEKAARPKSGGKPAKVYPTFDISPRVAKEFLERLKQEESKPIVDFQKDEERYTTWKNMEIQEEQEKQKQKSAEGKPATFAAALLAKLNISEAPAELPKGPAKPKLVARGPGAMNSPWKRAVPTIALDGVPSTLRPVLGYVLWRLHERETYSFAKDSSVLISDDQETTKTARQLGITVATFNSLNSKIQEQHKLERDVGAWGELEREFGDVIRKAPSPAKVTVQKDEQIDSVPSSELVMQEDLPVEEVAKELETVVVEVEQKAEKADEPKIAEKQPEETTVEEKASEVAQDLKVTPELSPQEQAAPKENQIVTLRAWADVVSNRTRPVQAKPMPPVLKNQDISFPADTQIDRSKDGFVDAVLQEKASTIADWVQKVKAAGSEPEPRRSPPSSHKKPRVQKTKEPTPPPEEPPKPFRPILMQRTPNSSQNTFDKGLSPPCTASDKRSRNGKVSNHTPSASISSIHSLSARAPSSDTPPSAKAPSSKNQTDGETPSQAVSAKAPAIENPATEEPEDSDEEVVVFEPRAKRMSAPPQAHRQASPAKPSVSQVHEPEPMPLADENTIKDHAHGFKQPSPDRAGPSKSRRQPKPRAPVVIDPDAFGRDFASNPRPHHHAPHPRSHQRPNSQHGLVQQRPIPQQGVLPNGVSPQRPMSQHGPPRPHPRGGRYQQNLVPPNRSSLPNGHPSGHMSNGQNGQGKANGIVRSMENENLVNGLNGQAPLASNEIPAQDLQPDKAGPDIDFVLRNGSMRGSTRGRGKLWIP